MIAHPHRAQPLSGGVYEADFSPDYVTATIAGKKLTLKAFKQDGTPLDTFFIDKAKDITSDNSPPPQCTIR
jgi:hypothetical protein